MATIRHMVEADAMPVSELLHSSWQSTYGPLMGDERAKRVSGERHSVKILSAEATDPNVISFVAEDGAAVVGYAMARMDEVKRPWLERLHVVPEKFGTGLAIDLLHAVLAAHAGLPFIDLEVLEGNDRAIRFYEKQGFATIDVTDACGGIEGVPARIMRKILPRA